MWSKVRRPLLVWVGVEAVLFVAGQVVARRLAQGDEDSDEFRVAAVVGGKRFRSRALRLRAGSVLAWVGGVELDLRAATLDATGATLDVAATMGGVQIMVPAGWAVDVDEHAMAGGVEVRVTGPDDLPDDAPTLNVRATARMGGVLVTTGSDG